MNRDSRFVAVAGAVAALAGGTWLFSHRVPAPPVALPPAAARAPVLPLATPEPVAEPAPRPAVPIQYPIGAPRGGTTLPPLAASDDFAKSALTRLLGRKSVRALLGLDGFVRNFVATVDNLAARRAPTLAWPVKTTPGRFVTEAGKPGTVIGGENADRYAPFVQLARSVDSKRAVALYVRLYPLFQQAWQELGPSGTYFNDRVVAVIDDLLATPDVPWPIRVRRAEVQGGARDGGLYVFNDPALEARSAGQKILLRMGKANADVLKAKLVEVRARITRGARRP
jgi:hypothetical protein